MGRNQEKTSPPDRRSYIQALNQLTECIVTGNICHLGSKFESLHKVVCKENREFISSMQNDTENPLFQSNLIIFVCKNANVKVLEYFLSTGKKMLLNIYNRIGMEFIHPGYIDSFKHSALYYAIRSSDVRLVDMLIEKWPGFDLNKNIDCFAHHLSVAYQEIRLRNVEISKEMVFGVESRLLNFELTFSDKAGNSVVTMPQIIARIDWLISKIRVTVELNDDSSNTSDILLQNLTTIAKNIHVLKSLLKSTYDAIPWEEMEFCVVTFVRTRKNDDELNVLYHSIITRKVLMSHLNNFSDRLKLEKINLTKVNDVDELKSFPNVNRQHAMKVIVEKYPYFQSLYQDFEVCRDARTLSMIDEYIDACSNAESADRHDRLTIVRTLQVIGQFFRNTLENPVLSEQSRKRIFSNVNEETRKIIIDVRNFLPNSFILSKKADQEDAATQRFFSMLLDELGSLKIVIRYILSTCVFRQVRKNVMILVDSTELHTVEEVVASFRCCKEETLIATGDIAKLEILVNDLERIALKSPIIALHTNCFVRDTNEFLSKLKFSYPTLYLVPGTVVALLQTCMANYRTSYLNVENQMKKIQTHARDTIGILEHYKNAKLSLKLGVDMINFLSTISPQLSKNEYYLVYRHIDAIINVICELDTDLQSIEELNTMLRNHNVEFSFDNYEPYPLPETYVITDGKSMDKIVSEMKTIVSVYGCDDKSQSFQVDFTQERGSKLVLELLMVEALYSTDHAEGSSTPNMYVEAKVPLLHGSNLLEYLIRKPDIVEIILCDPTTSVVSNARFIASGNISGSKGNLRHGLMDVDSLTEEDYRITNLVDLQQQLFRDIVDGKISSIRKCLENGADIYGKNFNGETTLHYAAKGPTALSMKTILDLWNSGVNVKTLDGVNPLHLAVYNGREECVKLLLNQKTIPVDEPDNFGRTPLCYSVYTEFTEITKTLLKFNADPNSLDMQGGTPLKHALRLKNNAASKMILNHEKFCYQEMEVGVSALNIAADSGLTEILCLVMKHIKDPKATEQISPLHSAAKAGNLECIKLCLANGYGVNGLIFLDVTPLYYGVISNNDEVVRLLIEKGADPQHAKSFFKAVRNGNINIIELLTSNKASINIVESETGMNPLHVAALQNNKAMVELLLKKGIRVNSRDSNGQTALHLCAQREYCELSKLLLKNGARVNISDKLGYFPHCDAVLTGNQELVELLVSTATINATNSRGYTALHCACRKGFVEIVRYLLEKGARVDVKAEDGRTAVHLAAMHGSPEIVDQLLGKGASFYDTDRSGFTALHYAAAFGREHVIQLLIQRGVNIDKISNLGGDPLFLACAKGSLECTSILMSNSRSMNRLVNSPTGSSLLQKSIKANNKEIVKLLVEKKVEISVDIMIEVIYSGLEDILEILLDYSPTLAKNSILLVTAINNRQSGIINGLIKRGADINAKCDPMGHRPLHLAVSKSDRGVIVLLLGLGAKPNMKDNAGNVPLHIAVQLGNIETVSILQSHESTILIKDKKGRTPIDLAVENGNKNIVELFLSHENIIDLNRNLFTKDCEPLLHIAARSGNVNVIKLLVDKGADINRRIDGDIKAIHIAAKYGFIDAVNFFLSRGMDPNDSDNGGNNVLHFAAQSTEGISILSHRFSPYVDRLKLVTLLVGEKHMDINKANNSGCTALHFAAVGSTDRRLINVLLMNGAHYDLKDSRGLTAKDVSHRLSIRSVFDAVQQLLTAVKRGDLLQVRKCIQQGAVIDAKNQRNETPLLYAAWKGNTAIVNELLSKGANPNVVGQSRSSPLHYATKSSHYKIVLALLGSGAMYESHNEGNQTPLNYAVETRITKILKLIENTFQKIKFGDVGVIKLIRNSKLNSDELKALANSKDRDGKTIIACAIITKFPDLKSLQSVIHCNHNLQKADILIRTRNFREAFSILSTERAKRQAMFKNDSLMNVEVDIRMSSLFQEERRYKTALRELKTLHDSLEKVLGEENELTVHIQSLTAMVLQQKGDTFQALKMFEAVIEKLKSVSSPLNPHLLKTQIAYGVTLCSYDKFKSALELLKDLLERSKIVHGCNHDVTLEIHSAIAGIYVVTGSFEDALKIYHQVLAERKKIAGPTDLDVLKTMMKIGRVYVLQKKFKEGVNMIVDAITNQPECKLLGLNKYDIVKQVLWDLVGNKQFDPLWHIEHNSSREEQEIRLPEVLDIFENISGGGSHGIFSSDDESDDGLTGLSGIHLFERFLHFIGNQEVRFDDFPDSEDVSSDDSITEVRVDERTAFQAVAKGEVEIVQKMIDSGVDFNVTDDEGRTLLHHAVSSRSVSMVEVLIENGSNVTSKSKKGNTALHTAALTGCNDIAEILIKNAKEADRCLFVDCKTNKTGTTALHISALKGHLNIVKTLLKNGATYNALNNENKTPLDLSVNEEVTSLLKKLDDIFNSFKSTTNSLKGLTNDSWNTFRTSRDAEGDTLFKITTECKDLILLQTCNVQSETSKKN